MRKYKVLSIGNEMNCLIKWNAVGKDRKAYYIYTIFSVNLPT